MNASLVVIHAKPELVSIPVCRFIMYIACSILSIHARRFLKHIVISRIRSQWCKSQMST